jgi:predicted phage tail protein
MNNLLTNYEPGKPEHKPKLMEQMKHMEAERNRRLEDHNKMLEAQNRIFLNKKQHTNTNTNSSIEDIKSNYENQIANLGKQMANFGKQMEDKVCLINELLKKIKDLTAELNEYKMTTVIKSI